MNPDIITAYYHQEQIPHISAAQYVTAIQFYLYGRQAFDALHQANARDVYTKPVLFRFLEETRVVTLAFNQTFIPDLPALQQQVRGLL